MQTITTIGLTTSQKSVFQVPELMPLARCVIAASEAAALSGVIQKLPTGDGGLEACGCVGTWSSEIQALAITFALIAAGLSEGPTFKRSEERCS